MHTYHKCGGIYVGSTRKNKNKNMKRSQRNVGMCRVNITYSVAKPHRSNHCLVEPRTKIWRTMRHILVGLAIILL